MQEELIMWDDKYSVGVDLLDAQHKHLIEMSNTLYTACIKDSGEAKHHFMEIIHASLEYVRTHFSTEEQIMEKIGYPGLSRHKKEHENFIHHILINAKEFEEGSSGAPSSLARYLKDWILSHIAIEDKQYYYFIRTHKPSLP
jgi:hemerythrin